jgi:hypothetical protein
MDTITARSQPSGRTKRNLVAAYIVASLASILLSNWALSIPGTALDWEFWILLGPIGLIGFTTFFADPWLTTATFVLYYLLATLALAVCLHFAHKTAGFRRYLAIAAIVFVWLICAYHNLYVFAWAA